MQVCYWNGSPFGGLGHPVLNIVNNKAWLGKALMATSQ